MVSIPIFDSSISVIRHALTNSPFNEFIYINDQGTILGLYSEALSLSPDEGTQFNPQASLSNGWHHVAALSSFSSTNFYVNGEPAPLTQTLFL